MSVKQNIIDQKEYLKKYLSGGKKKKKKGKRKRLEGKVKIIDDNLFASGNNNIDEELLLTGDDAPQIVGEVIEVEAIAEKVPKWRNIAVKEEPQDEDSKFDINKVKQEATADLWGRKASEPRIKDEFSPKQRKIKTEPLDGPSKIDRLHKHDSDSDLSLPRRRRRAGSNDSDLSLPRRRRAGSKDSDLSLPRRRRAGSNDSDLSLPRRRRRAGSKDSDLSLPRRRGRADSNDSDLSLPRRRRRADSKDSDLSLPRRRGRADSKDSDLSLPRRRRRADSKDSDLSLPRRRRTDSTPPRGPRNGTESKRTRDENSYRNRYNSPRRAEKTESRRIQTPEFVHSDNESDSITNMKPTNGLASPRMRIKVEKLTPPRNRVSRWSKPDNDSLSPPPTHKGKAAKTLDGKTAGLQQAQALKAETEQRRQAEERLFDEMCTAVSGRDAEIAVRNSGRKGRRAREAEAEDPEARRRREQREEQKKQIFERWGKGVKQVEDRRVQLEEEAYEASKPLARYSNDEDLDRYLRAQERTEDPMLEYMRQKKREQAKEDNVPVLPKYEGHYPENRFAIRPGYRWDGVDRSNGYEKRWFEVRNEKRAREEEAYKYSVEDM